MKLDGVLMPPDGPEEWPEKDSKQQWLVFYRLDGITFSGKGTVEGNGQKWWDLPCKPHRVKIFTNFVITFYIRDLLIIIDS